VDILSSVLVLAEEVLSRINIADNEIKYYMDIIKNGLDARMNGARWQLNMFEKLSRQCDKKEALKELVDRYYLNSLSNKPVHEWSESI